MVSNSGTMFNRPVPSASTRPASLSSSATSEKVRRASGHGNDVLGDRTAPNALVVRDRVETRPVRRRFHRSSSETAIRIGRGDANSRHRSATRSVFGRGSDRPLLCRDTEQFGDRRSCTAEFWRRSRVARWKPNSPPPVAIRRRPSRNQIASGCDQRVGSWTSRSARNSAALLRRGLTMAGVHA